MGLACPDAWTAPEDVSGRVLAADVLADALTAPEDISGRMVAADVLPDASLLLRLEAASGPISKKPFNLGFSSFRRRIAAALLDVDDFGGWLKPVRVFSAPCGLLKRLSLSDAEAFGGWLKKPLSFPRADAF